MTLLPVGLGYAISPTQQPLIMDLIGSKPGGLLPDKFRVTISLRRGVKRLFESDCALMCQQITTLAKYVSPNRECDRGFSMILLVSTCGQARPDP